jgi:biopolymer transport protein ExbD
MQKQQKVNEPIRKNLGKLIGDYKKQRAGLKTTFLVKGHPQVQYALFGKVIDALRDNEEFKYNLVTAEENAPTAVNPSTPGSLDLPEAKHSEDDRRSKYDSIETKLTLLLLNTHLIYGYEGKNIGAGKMYDYSSVHGIIFNGSKKYGNKFVVIIKPGKDASYKNTVDILDEMTINKIKRFEMIEMNEKEKRFIKKMNTKS